MGDSKTIRFWKDRWITDQPLENLVNDKALINTDALVSNFIANKQWNQQQIHQLSSMLPSNVIEKFNTYNLPQNDIQDRLYWAPSEKGWFSTKSAMDLIQKRNVGTQCDKTWIWEINIMPKVKNFL